MNCFLYLKVLFYLAFGLAITSVFGQGSARFYTPDDQLLFTLQNTRVADSNGTVLFTVANNIVFQGDSRDNEDMAYLLESTDLTGKRIGYIYKSDRELLYSFRKGRFYLGDNLNAQNHFLNIKIIPDKRVNLENPQNGELMGYGTGGNWSNAELLAIFLAYVERGYVGELVKQRMEVANQVKEDGIKGLIYKEFAPGFYHEWEWDGRILKPRYGNRPEDEWIFDGTYLRPYWGIGPRSEWVWDGQILKPYWQQIQELTFMWDGYSLRPYWDYRKEDEWIIEGDLARPKWNIDHRLEWRIKGEIPIPVIALVILGFADR